MVHGALNNICELNRYETPLYMIDLYSETSRQSY